MNIKRIKLSLVVLALALVICNTFVYYKLAKTSKPSVLGDTVVTSAISAGSDDSMLDNNVFSNTDTQPRIGKDGTVSVYDFFRFNNIAIPKNANIVSAYFSYSAATNENTSGVNVQVAANAVDNGVAPTSQAEFSSKAGILTTTKVSWNGIITQLYGDLITSPDIKAVINEITSRPGWASGNSILLYLGDNGTSNYANRKYMSYEFNSVNPKPTLTITYNMPNANPITQADTATTLAGDPVTIDVLANDSDPDGNTITIANPGSPSHGNSVITNNKIVYTPTTGYYGDDSLTYTISDGNGGTATGAVTIHVMNKSGRYLLTYTLNKSSVPDLYYKMLTLKIHLGTVTSPTVLVDSQAVDSVYNPSTGDLIFDTTGSNVQINFQKNGGISEVGSLTKAVLKDDKKWAWSHSLDDNTNLWGSINVLNSKNYRGTLYMIANTISDTRQESWIIDAPDMKTLLAQGWSFGNHTWDHSCSGQTTNYYNNIIQQGYDRIRGIIDASSVPTYKLLAFAAPCFASEYDSIIQSLVTAGTTQVKFNESGNNYALIMDPSSSDYTNSGKTAKAFNFTMNIGRDANLQLGNSGVTNAKAELDWMASNASSNRHFWYNTFAHGNNESYLSDFVDYLYNSYGAGGTNEVWQAPADEIYSYMLVRDNTTITYGGISSLANSNPVISNVGLVRAGDHMTVTWDTDKDSSSIIEYGLTSNYTNSTTEGDTSPRVQSHSVLVSNLVACSVYHFRIKSIDSSLNEGVTTDGVFTTNGCAGSSPITNTNSSSIDNAVGGTIQQITSGKGIILTIPSGYSPSTLNFQIKELDKPSVESATSVPSGYSAIGSSLFDLKALNNVSNAITTFNSALTITFQYSDSDIVGIDPSGLKIYRWDGSWHLLPGCSVNTSQKKVSCTTTNFSVFGLFALDSSSSSSQSSSSVSSQTTSSSSTTTSTTSSTVITTVTNSGNGTSQLVISHITDEASSSSKSSGANQSGSTIVVTNGNGSGGSNTTTVLSSTGGVDGLKYEIEIFGSVIVSLLTFCLCFGAVNYITLRRMKSSKKENK
ncbi:MAG: Ig-like domain-containing protein [bacterium]